MLWRMHCNWVRMVAAATEEACRAGWQHI
jgi:hypothetical protein